MEAIQGFSETKNSKKELFLDLFFPNKCPFCKEALHWTKYCHDKCYELSGTLSANDMICGKCGEILCKCGKKDFAYDFCVIGGLYENEYIKNAVLSMKYKQNMNSAEIFAITVSEKILSDSGFPHMDHIVPVPMNIKHERERGYNQAEIFGRLLSEKLNVPMKTDLLRKVYSKKSQHNRSAEERRIFAEAEYSAAENTWTDGNIILCDDIMTTGSTLNKCAAILKSMGAKTVTAAVCARA